ncbi:MAG: hypothetical protein OXE52_16710 [Chloroflexi bacterium]|nr:hypothetical protein [Chloroflexota bacterium]
MQEYEVEAFQGLELIFIHNHPNGSDASEADLRAAFAAGAEMLMVVTPQGYEYVYFRGADGMIPVRAEEFSYTKYHDWQTYDELEWPVMPSSRR